MNNLATQVRKPVNQENETLLTMAKAIDKNGIRNYSTVLGIQGGKVHATDGFSMLRWTPIGDIGEDRTIKTDLSESPVKYPNCSMLWPSENELKATTHKCFESLRLFLKPSWNKTPVMLVVQNDGKILLVPEGSKFEGGTSFNPWFFMRLCKGLPKGATCVSAEYAEERLLIKFESDVGLFEILLVAVRKN